MLYLVCFDVVDDRVRYRVVKTLKAFGVRVQKSVFECAGLSEEQFLRMKTRLEEHIDHAEDTVRYYHICRLCLPKVEYSGVGDPPQTDKFQVC